MGKDLLIILYGLPTLVAYEYRHPHEDYISKLNIYAGWTIIGWLVALAWALFRPRRRYGRAQGHRTEPRR